MNSFPSRSVIILTALMLGLVNCAENSVEPKATRSVPKDTRPYFREAVPEDYAPAGKDAIPSEIFVPQRNERWGTNPAYETPSEAEKAKPTKGKEE
jgi:hypothetical protein